MLYWTGTGCARLNLLLIQKTQWHQAALVFEWSPFQDVGPLGTAKSDSM